jgi:predicted transcriptional regulator of viral defense system
MMSSTTSNYARPQGLILLQSAIAQFGPIFTIEQIKAIAEEQGLSETHLRKLISELAASGWMKFIKRGTYAAQKPFIDEDLNPYAIAAALIQPMAISHWSAAAHHGFTTQLPRMVQASTPRKVVTPEMRQGQALRPRGRSVWQALGVDVEFIQIQKKHFFGHVSFWVNRWQQVAITDPERTALDLIARPDVFGGLRAAIDIFEIALTQINIERLVDYGLEFQVGSIIKRLGWLLEKLGIPDHEFARLQDFPVTTYYRLDPQSTSRGKPNPRWRIIENLRGTHA